jgi:hypothetical protein
MNKATDATGGERTRAPKSERQGSAVSKSRARAFGRDKAAKATNPAFDTPKKPARKGALWDAEEAAAVHAEQKRAFIRSVQGLCGHIAFFTLPKPSPVDDLIEHINANHFDEIQREFNDAVQCLRGAREHAALFFVPSTSNDKFEKLIRGCNEQLGLLIDGRKAALREAPATNGKGLVDKYQKPSYKRGMDGLTDYLKSRGVPESLQPKLAAKLDALVTAEITGRTAAPKLSEADLAAFKKHAAANQWNPESKPKVSPSAFIKETFKEWLGRGLTRKHIEDAQENLAWAYSTEVCRKASRRVEGLYVTPHNLPAGTPRPASKKLAAEMTDDELAETRKKNKTYKSASRQRQQSLHM